MKNTLLVFFLIALLSCSQSTEPNYLFQKEVVTESYEFYIPETQEALLILFPCFPCDAENTRTEFDILTEAAHNNVAVLLMNFNLHLWLEPSEKELLENIVVEATQIHQVTTENIFIGGFSGGGNVALLLSDYLKSVDSAVQPKGAFIVDAPIDLLGLYNNAKKNIEKGFSEVAIAEAKWIIEMLDAEFDMNDSLELRFQDKSPYIYQTHSLKNLTHLKDVKMRFYSEPDTLWWKENRQAEYEDMNAFYIEQLTEDLKTTYKEQDIEYIKTENKGYRTNGERHPHSWSIVDTEELMDWILSQKD